MAVDACNIYIKLRHNNKPIFHEYDLPQPTSDVDLHAGRQRFDNNLQHCDRTQIRWHECIDECVLNCEIATECESPLRLLLFDICIGDHNLCKSFRISALSLDKCYEELVSSKQFVNVQTRQLLESMKCCMKGLDSVNMPLIPEICTICLNATNTERVVNVSQNIFIDDTIYDSLCPHSSIPTLPMPETKNGFFGLKETPRSILGCLSAGKEKNDAMKKIKCYLIAVYQRSFFFTWSSISLPRCSQLLSPRLLRFKLAEADSCASNTVRGLSLGTINSRSATKVMTNTETVVPLIIHMHTCSCPIHEHATTIVLLQTTNYIILTRMSQLDDVRQLSMTHTADHYKTSPNKLETQLVKQRNLHAYSKRAWSVLTSITRLHKIQKNKRTRKAKENEPDGKKGTPFFQPTFSFPVLQITSMITPSVSPMNEPNMQQVLNRYYLYPHLTSNRERSSHTDKLALTSRVLQDGTAKTKLMKIDETITKSCCSQLPVTAEFPKWNLKTNVVQTANMQQSIPNVDKVKAQRLQTNTRHFKTNGDYIDPLLPKLPIKNQVMQDISIMVKANENQAGVMKPFFRQPPISRDFRIWTVYMMRTNVSKSAVLQPPTILGQPGMQNEWNRLATFASFDIPEGIFVIVLAGNGFFVPDDSHGKSTKEGQVECAFCSVVVPIVMFIHVKPMDVHKKVSPRCSVVLGQRTENFSIADVAHIKGKEFIKQFEPAFSACDVLKGSEMTQGLKGSENTLVQKDMQSGLGVTAIRTGTQGASQTTLIPKGLPNGSAMTPTPRVGHSADLAMDSEQPAVAGLAEAPEAAPSSKPGTSFALPVASSLHRQIPENTGNIASDSHASANSKGIGDQPPPYQTATYVSPAPARDSALATHSGTGATVTDASSSAPAAAAPAATTGQSGAGPGNGATGPSGRTGNGQERQTVTYEDLGIISQKPKRPDMAVTQTRINTFTGWIHEQTHPKEEMAEAGFYYTGHEDLVRCFHCKGGLKTWESSDTPWVEHARWFPRCPFIKLCKGQRFIDAVQKLNDPKTRPTISQEAVARQMKRMEDEERQKLSEDVVLFSNITPKAPLPNDTLIPTGLRLDANVTEASMEEMVERLEEENDGIRNLTLCKMCQSNEVNVLFLPCGHLVACAQCAPALTTCAMCRQPVKGSVRVHLDENKRDSERELEAAAPTDHKTPNLSKG